MPQDFIHGGVILEVEAEDLPRHIGPFSFRFQAEDWAKANVRDGSWSVIPLVGPRRSD